MQLKALSVLAGVGLPLIAAGTADAGFVGLSVVGKEAPILGPNAIVCNVFAVFNAPGLDRFISGAGTPNSPLDIHVVGGTFFQSPFGSDTAPNSAFFPTFPTLVFDTFVSIGQKATGPNGQPAPALTLTPGWPGFGPSALVGNNLGWANTPADPNTDPFNALFINGNGSVLIGQFSTTNGTGISGMLRILVTSDGVGTQLNVSFFHVPGPGALALMGTAGLIGRRRRRQA